MLPFSLIEMPRDLNAFPLYPYSVGRHIQYHHVRPAGFPVHQIFLIRSGSGRFRDLEDGTETVLQPGMAYAFPPDRGHEYYPLSHEPWHVGFIGFHGSQSASVLEGLGLLPPAPVPPRTVRGVLGAAGRDLAHGEREQLGASGGTGDAGLVGDAVPAVADAAQK
ncbi:AraC family ligand binding domain-containing protein [Paenibacillus rhizoplanae]